MQHRPEQQWFIPGDVEIVMDKNILFAKVSVHQREREGVDGTRYRS